MQNGYKKILLLLHSHSGVDFSLYRSTTILRRITRRLLVSKQESLEDYANFLRGNANELDALYSDVLISVTSFFRNPEMFEALQRDVFPTLLQQRSDEPVRCWVLGCSTGQEAYSIAMAFVESAEKAPRARRLQIFATDLNDKLLEKARYGLYARSLADDISPERLRRFFVEEQGGYRVSKLLREMVVFARQNFISDPPFSRMDIVSCRNLLIYLEPTLQNKALPTFHYALKPGGFLLLGASETVGRFTDLFEPVDRNHKIFVKKPAPTPGFYMPVRGPLGTRPARETPRPAPQLDAGPTEETAGIPGELNAQREADRLVVSQFAPPGVLINDELQVLQFRGPTGAYLEPPAGKASFDLLKMAREGLMLPLRSAIQQARNDNKAVRSDPVRVRRDGETRSVVLHVYPLRNLRERCFLVVFEESGNRAHEQAIPARPPLSKDEAQNRIGELEGELAETREYLQSVQEQQEAANEELQAANEEAQSANEELQSINEELETSKEELESANEELTTVNEEMNHRNVELLRLNNDFVNLQNSAKLVVIVVGRDLVIRRFSPQAEKQFELGPADLGRPIARVRHGLVAERDQPGADSPSASALDLEALAAESIASMQEQQREIRDKSGRWFALRARPYLTLDNKVDGSVLVLYDIDALKRNEQVMAEARDYAQQTVDTMRDPILVLDQEFRVESANRSFYRVFQVAPRETIGQSIFDLGNGQWDIPRLRDLLVKLLPEQTTIEDFAVDHDFQSIGIKTMLLNARRIIDPQRQSDRILLAIEDITQRTAMENRLKQQAAALETESRGKDEFLAMLSHELRNPLAPIRSALHLLRVHERSGGENPVPEHARKVIERQVSNLTKLVGDLLEMARLGSGRIRLERQAVDLNQIIQHAAESAGPWIEQRRQTLVLHLQTEPVWCNADAARIEEVFINLLSNAAKYTPDGGRIEVSCESSPGTDSASVRVRDNGIGIDSKLLPRIFDLFTQADRSLDRSAGGLGIGLSLAHRLVTLHGGSIDAQSPPNGLEMGSEFIVRLPLTSAPEMPLPPPRTTVKREKPAGIRVLVVDDNIDSATMLASVLRHAGYTTQSAYTGPDGLKVALQWRPEIVLLDIGLPGLDGYEVARQLRSNPVLANAGTKMKLIALTGYGRDSDVARAREAGFDAHMTKPIELDDLEKIMACAERLED